MSKRSRSRRRIGRMAGPALACLVLAALAQPHRVAVAGLAGGAVAAVLLLTPRVRKWVRFWLRRTVVYKHRSAGWPGLPRATVVYVGISNRPDLRRGQHHASSWWHPLTAPELYTQEWHRTRVMAALVEKWTIRARCPVGNTQHNRRYWHQAATREHFRMVAGSARTRKGTCTP